MADGFDGILPWLLNEFTLILIWGLFWGLLCLGLCAARLKAAPKLVGLAALACGLHACTLVLPSWSLWASLFGVQPSATWANLDHQVDWINKLLGLLLSACLVYWWKWVTPAEAKLRWPRPEALHVVGPVVAAVAALLLVDAYFSRHGFRTLWWPEQVFYSLVPGLEEELFYRGVLLRLLGRIFLRPLPLLGTRTSWGGLVSVVLFALGHSIKFPSDFLTYWHFPGGRHRWFYYSLSLFHFTAGELLYTCSMGLLFLWVRERTGSVWTAVATHCLLNTALTIGHAMS